MSPKLREMLPSIGRGFAEAYVGKRKAERERQMSLDEMIMREQMKQRFAPPIRWQPRTMQEALEFEREKVKIKPKKLPTAKDFKIIGMIRKLKDANATLEDIKKAISYEGEDPEKYSNEIGVYQPKPPWWRR